MDLGVVLTRLDGGISILGNVPEHAAYASESGDRSRRQCQQCQHSSVKTVLGPAATMIGANSGGDSVPFLIKLSFVKHSEISHNIGAAG